MKSGDFFHSFFYGRKSRLISGKWSIDLEKEELWKGREHCGLLMTEAFSSWHIDSRSDGWFKVERG